MNLYHVMLRGINRQQIFLDDMDYRQFIKTLFRFRAQSEYTIHAYCLMGNHVHLLIQGKNEKIGDSIRRIENSFVYYYNQKYKRTGHLFENRFRSEAIESEQYFLTVFRYILQNPVSAGICRTIYEYPWSSIILLRKNIERSQIKKYFRTSSEVFEYLEKSNKDKCLDWDYLPERIRLSDEEMIGMLCDISGCKSIAEFQKLDMEKQREFIAMLIKRNANLSQIARIAGVTRYQIAKIQKKIA